MAHVRQRGKTSFTCYVHLGYDTDGKKQTATKTIRTKSVKEARMECQLWEIELKRGGGIQPGKQTVAEFLLKWIEDYGKTNLSPTTYEDYKYIINAHLIKQLGKIPIAELKPTNLQSYYNTMLTSGKKSGGGLSPRSVRYHHAILREALSHAVKWQIINRNIADLTEPPKPQKPKINFLNPEDMAVLIETMREHPLFPLYFTAIMTGMRRSELLGLRWQDVDMERRSIYLQQAMHHINGVGFITTPTKNKKGRIIGLPASVVEVLNTLDKKSTLVFCRKDGQPLRPDTVSNTFRRLATKAGFPNITLHAGTRHTHATYLLAAGIPAKVVQERLGHETISITLDTYSHVVPSLHEIAVAKLDELDLQKFNKKQKEQKEKPGI